MTIEKVAEFVSSPGHIYAYRHIPSGKLFLSTSGYCENYGLPAVKGYHFETVSPDGLKIIFDVFTRRRPSKQGLHRGWWRWDEHYRTVSGSGWVNSSYNVGWFRILSRRPWVVRIGCCTLDEAWSDEFRKWLRANKAAIMGEEE